MKISLKKIFHNISKISTTTLMIILLIFSPLFPIISFPQQADAASPFAAIWVNDGKTIIFQEDRPVSHPVDYIASTTSYIWDGNTINLKGAKNEVVDFNLMLEGNDNINVSNVTVNFDKLTGPNGYELNSKQVAGNNVFDYVDREIELFYIKYPQWNAISNNQSGDGLGLHPIVQDAFRYDTDIANRPNWHKHVPDIAIPLELINPSSNNAFTVDNNKHQAIWADIYIPRDAPAGQYSGNVVISVNGNVNQTIPVNLIVHNFALPDTKNSRNTALLNFEYILIRFFNNIYTDYNYYTGPDKQNRVDMMLRTVNNIRKMAHRHRIVFDLSAELINADNLFTTDGLNAYPSDPSAPLPQSFDPDQSGDILKAHLTKWLKPALSGDLFTQASGYAGPGDGVGDDIHMIWPYFMVPTRMKEDDDGFGLFVPDVEPVQVNTGLPTLQWWPKTKRLMLGWAPVFNDWFAQNAPGTDYMYYALDESAMPTIWNNELARLLDSLSIPQNGKKMRVFTTRPPTMTVLKDAAGTGYHNEEYRTELGSYELVDGPPVGRSVVRLFLSQNFPYIDIWAYNHPIDIKKDAWLEAVNVVKNAGNTGETDHFGIHYNGSSPQQSSFSTDNEYLRALEWTNQKFQPGNVHFYYMANGWANDAFGGTGDQIILNFWEDVHTHGKIGESLDNPAPFDNKYGRRWVPDINDGGTYESGSGVLIYPGTDVKFPEHNYNTEGAFASLRMKFWRRSIQDAEYIIMARQHNEFLTKQVIDTVIPRGLWETTDRSMDMLGFEIDGDRYNAALEALTTIIKGQTLSLGFFPPRVSALDGHNVVRTGLENNYSFTLEISDDADSSVHYWGEWGDGNVIATTTTNVGTTSLSHVFLAQGEYKIKIHVKDSLGHTTSIQKKIIAITNNTPFNISAVHVGDTTHQTTETTATIFWTLSDYGTGQVEYGLTPEYSMHNLKEHSFLYAGHRQILTALLPGTKYHYRVISENQFGDQVISEDRTFTTLGTQTDSKPILAEITPPPSQSGPRPSFTFYSTKPGSITYGGSCQSQTTQAVEGNNTVVFDTLPIGTYSNCTITVTNSVTNIQSDQLHISSFSVTTTEDLTPPTITMTADLYGNVNVPLNVILSLFDNMSQNITYWGSWDDGEIIATSTTQSSQESVTLNHTFTYSDDFLVRIYARDENNNSATQQKRITVSGAFAFLVGPYVTSVTPSSAVIRWKLNEPGTGELRYGIQSPNSLREPSEHNAIYQHVQEIHGLNTCTTYKFNVSSYNIDGGHITSPTASFTTGGCTSQDVTPPVLQITEPVVTPTKDNTPRFSFSSTEGGSITYAGGCTSPTIVANPGINTITINELQLGTYSNCTITVTDLSGNVSQVLHINEFEITQQSSACVSENGTVFQNGSVVQRERFMIDPGTQECLNQQQHRTCNSGTWTSWSGTYTLGSCDADVTPPITTITASIGTTTDTTPSIDVSFSEDVTLTYGGACHSQLASTTAGVTTIVFDELAPGTYSDCTITATDLSGNVSQPFQIPEFTINWPIRADINVDGGVSVADAQLILRKAMDLSVATWPSEVTAGDVNCSGAINVADAQLTLRKAMSLGVSGWCDAHFPES